MRVTSVAALILGLGKSVLAQDLPKALSQYPELSMFQGLISQVPGGVTQLLPRGISPNSSQGVTVLIPSDTALKSFLNTTGVPDITSVPPDQLVNILFYHIMYAKLTSGNFSAPGGLIVPTLLKDKKYNNRSAGAELINTYGTEAAQGNVLYISKDPITPAKFRVRQKQDNSAALRGGMGEGGTINAVDGKWDLGYFQIIDTVLSPPAPCSNTIKSQASLEGLNHALTKADLWEALDHSPNVTCLAPNNKAFKDAGDPQTALNSTDLANALLFHTLPMPLYSTYITSGMVLQSLAGLDVTVAEVDGELYFNDAKVVSPNVLTNNGLIHVLDRVMSPNGTAPAATGPASTTSTATTTSATATGTGSGTTATASESAKPTNGANAVAGSNAVGVLLAFLVAGAVLV